MELDLTLRRSSDPDRSYLGGMEGQVWRLKMMYFQNGLDNEGKVRENRRD